MNYELFEPEVKGMLLVTIYKFFFFCRTMSMERRKEVTKFYTGMLSCHENIKFISSSHRVMFFLLYGD